MNKKIEEEYPILKSFFRKSDQGNQIDIIIEPFSSKKARKLNCEEHLALMDLLHNLFKRGRLTKYFNLYRECGPDEEVFGEDSPEKSFLKNILSKEIDLIYELIANNPPEKEVLNYLAIAKSHLPRNLQGNNDKEFLRFRNTIETQFDLFSTKLNLKQNEEQVRIQKEEPAGINSNFPKQLNRRVYLFYELGIIQYLEKKYEFKTKDEFNRFLAMIMNADEKRYETVRSAHSEALTGDLTDVAIENIDDILEKFNLVRKELKQNHKKRGTPTKPRN